MLLPTRSASGRGGPRCRTSSVWPAARSLESLLLTLTRAMVAIGIHPWQPSPQERAGAMYGTLRRRAATETLARMKLRRFPRALTTSSSGLPALRRRARRSPRVLTYRGPASMSFLPHRRRMLLTSGSIPGPLPTRLPIYWRKLQLPREQRQALDRAIRSTRTQIGWMSSGRRAGQ